MSNADVLTEDDGVPTGEKERLLGFARSVYLRDTVPDMLSVVDVLKAEVQNLKNAPMRQPRLWG